MFQPGDLLLVSRKLTLRSFLAGPITFLICRRIQKSTASKWNHVACVISDSEVVEADMMGIVRTKLTRYFEKQWKYDFARISIENNKENRAKAVSFWMGEIGAKYDFKWILAIRIWIMLYGHDGLTRIQALSGDRFWICSELAAEGIKKTGYVCNAIAPADFENFIYPPNIVLTPIKS